MQYGTKLGLAGLLALYCANVSRLEHSSWSILTVVVMMNSGIFIPRSIGSGSKPESTDHGFGLLRPDDREKMEQIISERSDGSYGAPALHGMLTASVIGPKPVPMDWILPTVLSPPESEAIGFDNFLEFNWVAEKIEEWVLRIGWVFQEDPELFSLLVLHAKTEGGGHDS